MKQSKRFLNIPLVFMVNPSRWLKAIVPIRKVNGPSTHGAWRRLYCDLLRGVRSHVNLRRNFLGMGDVDAVGDVGGFDVVLSRDQHPVERNAAVE